jgi:hypothetical protein
MMKKTITNMLLFVSLGFSLMGCGASSKVTYSWTNKNYEKPQNISKIFVAALLKNPHVREHLEENMVNTTKSQGYIPEKSMDYFTPNITDKVPTNVETMMDKIKSLNCDLIFTINLVDKTSETRYIPGGMPYYGPFPGYGLHFRGFYSYWYPFIYDPGYYVTDKKYFMEGNLFDAHSGMLLWTIQTESLNPESVEKFSKDLIDLMLRRALSDLGKTSME